MKPTLGIPRALYYYYYYPFWKHFFTELGFSVVLSGPTTKEILDKGVLAAVDSTCLPVKVYYGHVLSLIEENVDYLWIPQIVSVAKGEYICPKFMGLPDMMQSLLPRSIRAVSPLLSGKNRPQSIFYAYLQLGLAFKPHACVLKAYLKGLLAQRAFCASLEKGVYLPTALEEEDLLPAKKTDLVLGLLGHRYVLYDPYTSMNLLRKLLAFGVRVVTLEELSPKLLEKGALCLKKRMFWTSGKRILGALPALLPTVHGLISLSAFGCGTDSLTLDLVERASLRKKIPHLSLNLDEHTGEAGVVTRLEAFFDLLSRKREVVS